MITIKTAEKWRLKVQKMIQIKNDDKKKVKWTIKKTEIDD